MKKEGKGQRRKGRGRKEEGTGGGRKKDRKTEGKGKERGRSWSRRKENGGEGHRCRAFLWQMVDFLKATHETCNYIKKKKSLKNVFKTTILFSSILGQGDIFVCCFNPD